MTDRPVGGRANPAAVGQRLQQDGDVVVGWREVQGSPAASIRHSYTAGQGRQDDH